MVKWWWSDDEVMMKWWWSDGKWSDVLFSLSSKYSLFTSCVNRCNETAVTAPESCSLSWMHPSCSPSGLLVLLSSCLPVFLPDSFACSPSGHVTTVHCTALQLKAAHYLPLSMRLGSFRCLTRLEEQIIICKLFSFLFQYSWIQLFSLYKLYRISDDLLISEQ